MYILTTLLILTTVLTAVQKGFSDLTSYESLGLDYNISTPYFALYSQAIGPAVQTNKNPYSLFIIPYCVSVRTFEASPTPNIGDLSLFLC